MGMFDGIMEKLGLPQGGRSKTQVPQAPSAGSVSKTGGGFGTSGATAPPSAAPGTASNPKAAGQSSDAKAAGPGTTVTPTASTAGSAPSGSTPADAATTVTPPSQTTGAAPTSAIDVIGKLESLAAANPQKLNWRESIVDLLKLLGLDSSLTARKDLAAELGCPPEKMGDSAQMNIWLHKTVMQKFADNGGNVPKDLLK